MQKYVNLGFYYPNGAEFYISENDEVINFEPFTSVLKTEKTIWVPNSNHRFNGPEFDSLIETLKR
jgi:hypothetical protein